MVGVVKDVERDTRSSQQGTVYVPFAQHFEPRVTMLARAKSGGESVAGSAIRRSLIGSEREAVIVFEANADRLTGPEIVLIGSVAVVAGGLGTFAVALSCFGLYGLISHVVTIRMREFGIRLALGATPTHVAFKAFAVGIAPVLIGVVTGLAVVGFGVWAMRPFAALLGDLNHVGTIAVSTLALLVVTSVASAIPAWRAATAPPSVILRND